MNKQLEIFEINTATWLSRLSEQTKTRVTLASVPAREWDAIARRGFNSVWLMGIWQRSPAALSINRSDEGFMSSMSQVLEGFDPEIDLIGSAYSIQDYKVNQDFGGEEGLIIARKELRQRGLKLIVDFVPNHVAPDHPWTKTNPDFFVPGTDDEFKADPGAFICIGDSVFARGKDPQYAPWIDVVQLNAFSPTLRLAEKELLTSISDLADGIRCDMAMLMLNRVFSQTWGERVGVAPPMEYWEDIISAVHAKAPEFLFVAESYWNTQEELIACGFDHCYDKEFLDYMVAENFKGLSGELRLPLNSQRRLIRFLENHDEERAATTFFESKHRAAALIIATTPGSHLFYEGQFEGKKIRTPVHLKRDPAQPIDDAIAGFYRPLLDLRKNIGYVAESFSLLVAKKPILAWQLQSNSQNYLVVINFGPKVKKAKLRVKFNQVWQIFNTQNDQMVQAKLSQKRLSLVLDGYQGVVFKCE